MKRDSPDFGVPRMFRIKLRIGTKLAIASGVGVILVAAMVLNEQFSNRAVEQLTKLVVQHDSVAKSAVAADDAFRRIQLANRDMRAALNPEDLKKARGGLEQAASDGEQIVTKLEQEAVFAENRERFAKIHQLFKEYFAGGREIGEQQAKLIDSVGKREEALQNWNQAYAAMLESPGMAGLAFRREIEFNIREANSLFKDARIAAWRVMATNEVVQIDRIAKIAAETIDMLKRARNLAHDKTIGDGIDALSS